MIIITYSKGQEIFTKEFNNQLEIYNWLTQHDWINNGRIKLISIRSTQ